MEQLLKIGITHGDMNGIGYEVILKMLNDNRLLELCTLVIFGSSKAVGFYKKLLNLEHINLNIVRSAAEAAPRSINIVNCISGDDVKVEVGKATTESGTAAYAALAAATEALNAGHIAALVTAPINKATIQSADFKFHGHTEYFESTNNAEALMILMHDHVRVALVTTHLPLSEVTETLTRTLILSKIELLNRALIEDFTIRRPRIAVLALNPHAGDNGLLGDQEQEIIMPAIAEAVEKGIVCVGPFAADGFFGSGAFDSYDAVLAMYHDQGLAPFKALFMDGGVNYTAGLPIVRTSPAHGTAYDIAGKNVADAQSIREAVYTACDVVRNRRLYAEISANPLQIVKQEDRRHNRDHAFQRPE